MERVECSPSWESMPFEARIAIKMLLTFLDSLDPNARPSDSAIAVQMLRGFVPILKSFILSFIFGMDTAFAVAGRDLGF